MRLVSRTRCSVLHDAPQSRDPRRCGVHGGPRSSSAPLRAAQHPGHVSVRLERASKDGPAPWFETLASRAVHHEDFAHPLRSDVPDGQISWCFAKLPVQPRLQKYFRIRLTRIKSISIASRPTEGRSRVVTNAGRDAVDARASGAQSLVAGRDEPRERSASARDERRFSGRQSRVVPTPVAGSKLAEAKSSTTGFDQAFNPPVTVTTRIRSPGRARNKP